MHRVLITLTLGCVLATYSTASGFAQEPDFSTKLDNTKVNQRDRQADERTAERFGTSALSWKRPTVDQRVNK
jgi:hypothetical protein